jgi:hypothetical protein
VTSSSRSRRTSSKEAVPVALPLRPRWSATWSREATAKKRSSSRSWRSPASDGEQLVKGVERMEMQAPSAVG